MLSGIDTDLVFLISNAGNGFISKIADLETKNKSGKALLKAEPATALKPLLIPDISMRVAILTSAGKLAVLDLADIAQMSKGKGSKIINITAQKFADGAEQVIDHMIFSRAESIHIKTKNKKLKLSPRELDHYLIERGKSGVALPKGYQTATGFDL